MQVDTTITFDSALPTTIVVKSGTARDMQGVVNGLTESTTYFARVRALSSDGQQFPPSENDYVTVPGFVRTGEAPVTLAKPVVLQVNHRPEAVDFNKLEVVWSTVTSAESYTLERRRTSGTTGEATVFQIPAPAEGAAVSFVDNGPLLPNTRYYYRVIARAGSNASLRSEPGNQVTKAAPVTAWGTFEVFDDTIVARWTASGNAGVNGVDYRLLYSFPDAVLVVLVV
jgi:hypothetical protein